MGNPRNMGILAVPGVQMLDVAGPLDVLAEANRQTGKSFYRPIVIGLTAAPIRSSSGIRLLPDATIQRDLDGALHTLLVAGAPHMTEFAPSRALVQWLCDHAKRCRRYGSICSGVFVLASAGLLTRRRVTTHWSVVHAFLERYPDVLLEEEALHVADGRLRTAAGVTAGLDLALSFVEEDLGREVAMKVASELVMYFRRPGGQTPFSRQGEAVVAGRASLQELQRWVAANPAEEHSIDRLAKRMHLSARHFTRLFRSEVGTTPAAWVESARVGVARQLLERGMHAPKQVAALCGFTNVNHLRRAFVQHVGITPADYRKQYVVPD